MLSVYLVIVHILTSLGSATSEGIETSKLFVVPVKSEMFNWGPDAKHDQYLYQSSLLDAPDLPPWIRYTYSKRYHHGFLYGVPPADQDNFQLEIVGLNKHTYETRYKILNVNVERKEDPAKREVQLKIDNLNVEDMFDKNRTQSLLDIFRTKLWTDATDLYVTFMASAIEMGARLPLKPGEGDGVVVRLGSVAAFSPKMHTLQEEVKPLWKLSSCPRDFKKTSVEILFRSEGFLLDWCSFRLIEEDHRLHEESARRDSNLNVVGLPSAGLSGHTEWRWARPTKSEIPKRSYVKEMATIVLIPGTLLVILAGFLSATLCFHHDKVPKRDSLPVEGLGNNSEVQMVQYASSQRGGTLRSLSAQPSSPSDSLTLSPRTSTERCVPYMRPSPPPYMRPQNAFSGGNRTDF